MELGHPVVLLRARTSDSLTVTASHASGVAAHSKTGAGKRRCGMDAMEQMIDCCGGLDVHRDTVVATVRAPGSQQRERRIATRTFTTTTSGLSELGDWLVAEHVELVGMESTGVYWKPVFFALEERIDQVWLLNAEHLRNVPGRKPMSLTRCGSPNWSSTGWCGRVLCRRPISVRCGI